MQTQNLIGIAAGCLTAVSLLPQIIKVIRERNAESISALMPFVLLIGNGLWVFYGILLSAWPITITNAFSVVCDLLPILLRFRFKAKS